MVGSPKIIIAYETIKDRFYVQEAWFNNFSDITDERINEIDKMVKDYKEVIKPIVQPLESFHRTSQEYSQILSMALNNNSLTWDEKMVLVIRYMDPEFKLLDLFLETESNRAKTMIEETDNDFVKKDLIADKEKDDAEFIKHAREAIGVYDVNLLKYELKLYNKISTVLRFNVKKNYITSFFSNYVTKETNLNIDKKEYMAITLGARSYKNKYGIPSINDLSYQLIEQSKIIGVRSPRIAMPFMIYVLDSGFKALKIYEENSNWNKINDATKSELGFKCREFVTREVQFINENPTIAAKLELKPFK